MAIAPVTRAYDWGPSGTGVQGQEPAKSAAASKFRAGIIEGEPIHGGMGPWVDEKNNVVYLDRLGKERPDLSDITFLESAKERGLKSGFNVVMPWGDVVSPSRPQETPGIAFGKGG